MSSSFNEINLGNDIFEALILRTYVKTGDKWSIFRQEFAQKCEHNYQFVDDLYSYSQLFVDCSDFFDVFVHHH